MNAILSISAFIGKNILLAILVQFRHAETEFGVNRETIGDSFEDSGQI